MELVAGFFCILVGQALLVKLKNIRVSADIRAKPYDEVMANSDYRVFNHRGRYLTERVKNAG